MTNTNLPKVHEPLESVIYKLWTDAESIVRDVLEKEYPIKKENFNPHSEKIFLNQLNKLWATLNEDTYSAEHLKLVLLSLFEVVLAAVLGGFTEDQLLKTPVLKSQKLKHRCTYLVKSIDKFYVIKDKFIDFTLFRNLDEYKEFTKSTDLITVYPDSIYLDTNLEFLVKKTSYGKFYVEDSQGELYFKSNKKLSSFWKAE